jgi:hypothetical protein
MAKAQKYPKDGRMVTPVFEETKKAVLKID